MFSISPVSCIDFYKADHRSQYPKGTELVFSNLTARKSRVAGSVHTVFFGLQYFMARYLQESFRYDFFNKEKSWAVHDYKRHLDAALGKGAVDCAHIEALYDLGHLPLEIWALPEGSLVPTGVPSMVMWNTRPEFFWVTNYIETLLSCVLWMPITSATTAHRYRQILETAARKTGGSMEFVPWQAHDFSMRGMPGPEAAALSGAAHLLSFCGTDCLPAIYLLEKYYCPPRHLNADVTDDEFLATIGGSIPATEHSVMSMGGNGLGELSTIFRLITDVYPSGPVSIVADTWDFWQVISEYLPKLRNVIMARDGKLVVRPDSGDPVKILCGDDDAPANSSEHVGAIQCLWNTFGGETNQRGYKVLDPHIGIIYGDSITAERCKEIVERLEAKGFASTNVVLGLGSYTYQYVTRDTYGIAVKATYGEVKGNKREIYKQPKTDDGTKFSARGLLAVYGQGDFGDSEFALRQSVNFDEVKNCSFEQVFRNGTITKTTSLPEIRARLARARVE